MNENRNKQNKNWNYIYCLYVKINLYQVEKAKKWRKKLNEKG